MTSDEALAANRGQLIAFLRRTPGGEEHVKRWHDADLEEFRKHVAHEIYLLEAAEQNA